METPKLIACNTAQSDQELPKMEYLLNLLDVKLCNLNDTKNIIENALNRLSNTNYLDEIKASNSIIKNSDALSKLEEQLEKLEMLQEQFYNISVKINRIV